MRLTPRSLARAMCAMALGLFASLSVSGAVQEKPDIFVQLGHSNPVGAVAFSPNPPLL